MSTAAAKKSSNYIATGRRKNAVARVQLREGMSEITVNGRKLENFFPAPTLRMMIAQPFETLNMVGRFGAIVTVRGGGLAGQAGAVRLGLSRALIQFDPSLQPSLRKNGFLTRDPRKKERKKFGRKGARRSFQYTKR